MAFAYFSDDDSSRNAPVHIFTSVGRSGCNVLL